MSQADQKKCVRSRIIDRFGRINTVIALFLFLLGIATLHGGEFMRGVIKFLGQITAFDGGEWNGPAYRGLMQDNGLMFLLSSAVFYLAAKGVDRRLNWGRRLIILLSILTACISVYFFYRSLNILTLLLFGGYAAYGFYVSFSKEGGEEFKQVKAITDRGSG